MEHKNNFQELYELPENNAPEDIKKEISNTKNFLDTLGGIIELVIPRIFQSILGVFTDGNDSKPRNPKI